MTSCCGLGLFGVDYLGGEAPSLEDVRAGRGVLKKGAKGDSVAAIQKLVGLTGADADGDFGPKTDAAVRRFQGANGLKVDGAVGKGTMVELDKAAGGSVIAPATSAEADFMTVVPPAAAAPQKTATKASGAASTPASIVATETTTKSRFAVAAALLAAALATGGIVYALKS